MTIFWNGIGLLLSGLAAVLVLKETRKEFVLYILLTMCILTFLLLIPLLQETVGWMSSLAGERKYTMTILKAAGISLLTEVACELCKACGENGIAGYAALVGKGEILLLTLPIFREFTELAVGFVE